MMRPIMSSTPTRKILSVSELNRDVSALLEQEFAWVWVEAEISNLARPASGHIYFSLKDDNAQVRCAMFRSRNNSVSFKPENGQQVVVRGKVSLYQPRGDYQLIVDRMEAAGEGALRARFEALKSQLAAEGLFDTEHKREIPLLPACIGVITSNTGAAVRDVLSVIARRFPSVPVKLFPVPVQGDAAAPAICRALALAETMAECDVLLLVRGGGSLEDLWAFNEASVARSIYACPIPVVSGVGHETDITIADFVADLRAATPTAAAEAVTPDQASWQRNLAAYGRRLQQLVLEAQQQRVQELRWLKTRLWQQHPTAVLQGHSQRLDEIEQRLLRAWRMRAQAWHHHQQQLGNRLLAASPLNRLRQNEQHLRLLVSRMQYRAQTKLEKNRAGLERLASTLNAISPLSTLARGYSITTDEQGQAITQAGRVAVDSNITTRLHAGRLISKVIKHLDD
jgi:exodeoxyribonuclease VII large subunit